MLDEEWFWRLIAEQLHWLVIHTQNVLRDMMRNINPVLCLCRLIEVYNSWVMSSKSRKSFGIVEIADQQFSKYSADIMKLYKNYVK